MTHPKGVPPMIRTLTVAAAFGLAAASIAAPADASSYGANSRASHSVIYTRHCLNYSSSSCALHKIQPGQNFPRDTVYAMPGYGWQMCDVRDGYPCIYGSSYVRVDTLGLKFLVWYVS